MDTVRGRLGQEPIYCGHAEERIRSGQCENGCGHFRVGRFEYTRTRPGFEGEVGLSMRSRVDLCCRQNFRMVHRRTNLGRTFVRFAANLASYSSVFACLTLNDQVIATRTLSAIVVGARLRLKNFHNSTVHDTTYAICLIALVFRIFVSLTRHT